MISSGKPRTDTSIQRKGLGDREEIETWERTWKARTRPGKRGIKSRETGEKCLYMHQCL